MDSDFALAHNQLAQAYLEKHMVGDAISELQKAMQLSDNNATCVANMARAYAASGRTAEATKLLNDLKSRLAGGSPVASELATVYTALGDKTQAMAWLEKGYEDRFNPGVLLRPAFDPLRSDPRFKALVQRIGLPR
jgi:Flp pilus assembly protein TadD